jgi:hypothetical protein
MATTMSANFWTLWPKQDAFWSLFEIASVSTCKVEVFNDLSTLQLQYQHDIYFYTEDPKGGPVIRSIDACITDTYIGAI